MRHPIKQHGNVPLKGLNHPQQWRWPRTLMIARTLFNYNKIEPAWIMFTDAAPETEKNSWPFLPFDKKTNVIFTRCNSVWRFMTKFHAKYFTPALCSPALWEITSRIVDTKFIASTKYFLSCKSKQSFETRTPWRLFIYLNNSFIIKRKLVFEYPTLQINSQ